MKIDHMALYVQDLEAARTFFMTFFAATSNDGYHNPKSELKTYFLTFDDGARLELMNRPGIKQDAGGQLRTGYIHLAFGTGSRERVDTLTAQLHHAGYKIISGPRITGDGYYESCIEGPEGCLIELTV